MRRLGWAVLGASAMLFVSGVLAQPHRGRRHPAPPTPGAVPDAGPVIPRGSNFDPNEVIPVPVASVDGMLRRMRVYLFVAPSGSQAFGGARAAGGQRLWALLPSCRPTNPDDNRDPCPVDRLVVEAVGSGNVTASDPSTLGTNPDARRVQWYSVGEGVPRVRVKLFAPGARLRYEAVMDAARLVDLPVPQGSDQGSTFAFDFTQYPAR